MEAATCAFKPSFGFGPRGLNQPQQHPEGPQQQQSGPGPQPPGPGPQPPGPGPQHPGSGPPGAPRPEEPHSKPFFYVQPPQSFMPMQGLQWSVPLAMPHLPYSPYYGYPGLGYGMQMMPHYQPNPYMDPPGFVMPHTHLHLLDYRRVLNPQHYQTMAYHSRKFRYQQHGSPSRHTSTAEVQTEPLTAPRSARRSGPGGDSAEVESPSVQDLDSSFCVPSRELPRSVSAVQKANPSQTLKQTTSSSSATKVAQNGGFVIQTEEVRIECCAAPVGLQLLCPSETGGGFSQDVVQRGSSFQDEAPSFSTDESDRPLGACPDILLVAEKFPTPEESKNQSEKHLDETSDDLNLKVVHLPFDQQYLDELRKMESSVWSMEETLIASPQSLIQNVSVESLNGTLTGETTVVLSLRDENTEMLPQGEKEEAVLSVEPREADFYPSLDVPAPEEAQGTEEVDKEGGTEEPELAVSDKSPLKAERNEHRPESGVPEPHQDTSFESLPAYLPSTSWVSDIDEIYYYGKIPPAPQKWYRPPSKLGLDIPTRRRKLELKEQPRKWKIKPRGQPERQSLSDHEYCLSRGSSENAFGRRGPKQDQLCSRCVANIAGVDGRGLKRKAVPFHQWNHGLLLPTCEACRSHPKRRPTRNGSIPDVGAPRWGLDTAAGSGDSSENSSCRTGPKWRSADPKRPLGSKQLQPVHPKLREKNCGYEEELQPAARERTRHCPHGNAFPDENSAVQTVQTVQPVPLEQRRNLVATATHRWQTTERSWKTGMPNTDVLGVKNDAQSQYWNKHTQPQPPSQGIYRRDTRC